jgi:predicted PP-loop superfamily ATPase
MDICAVGVEDSQSGLEPGKLKPGGRCAKLRDEVVMNMFRARFVSFQGNT